MRMNKESVHALLTGSRAAVLLPSRAQQARGCKLPPNQAASSMAATRAVEGLMVVYDGPCKIPFTEVEQLYICPTRPLAPEARDCKCALCVGGNSVVQAWRHADCNCA